MLFKKNKSLSFSATGIISRSDGDLNPGYRYQYTSLAGKRLRPLGHRSRSRQGQSDGEGFEPPEACTSTVFKTASVGLSDIHPICFMQYKQRIALCQARRKKGQITRISLAIHLPLLHSCPGGVGRLSAARNLSHR